jgi:hypothetical protein
VSLTCHEVRELFDAFIGDQLLIETINQEPFDGSEDSYDAHS